MHRVMGLKWGYTVPPQTVRDKFSCREPHCAEFYREYAARYQNIGASCVITAWADELCSEVAGFITFSPFGLRSGKYREAIARVLGDEYALLGDKTFPCWLIGQLARADHQSLKGLGEHLVWLAIMDILQRSAGGAGSCIVIEAENMRLAEYYRDVIGFDPFHPLFENWKGGKLMLSLPIAKAEQMLEDVAPSS